MTHVSVTWRGKTVHNTLAKVCVVVALLLLIPAFLLSVPLHVVLRVSGRQGFLLMHEGEHVYHLGRQGFEPAHS
jgi:hypothetical protein